MSLLKISQLPKIIRGVLFLFRFVELYKISKIQCPAGPFTILEPQKIRRSSDFAQECRVTDFEVSKLSKVQSRRETTIEEAITRPNFFQFRGSRIVKSSVGLKGSSEPHLRIQNEQLLVLCPTDHFTALEPKKNCRSRSLDYI